MRWADWPIASLSRMQSSSGAQVLCRPGAPPVETVGIGSAGAVRVRADAATVARWIPSSRAFRRWDLPSLSSCSIV